MTPTKKLIERGKLKTAIDDHSKELFAWANMVNGASTNKIQLQVAENYLHLIECFTSLSVYSQELIEHLERYERALEKCKEEFEMMFCEDVCNEINAELEAILNPQEKGE